MKNPGKRSIEAVHQLFEETGDPHLCLERFPEFADEIEMLGRLQQHLGAPPPASTARDVSRQRLLTAVSGGGNVGPRTTATVPGGILLRIGGAFAALLLVGGAVVGAGAAPNISEVKDTLHNLGVLDKLPEGVQNRIGAGMSRKPDNVPPVDAGDSAQPSQHQQADSPGAPVSGGVHEAIQSTPPGPARGEAVRQQACDNAHDRSRLPEQAQQAPGRNENAPDPCAFENNAGGNDGAPPPNPGQGTGGPPGNPDQPTGRPENPGQGQGGPPAENPGQGQGQGNNPSSPPGQNR